MSGPHLIQSTQFHEAWDILLKLILEQGQPTHPRGLYSQELLNVTLSVSDGYANVLVNTGRDLNYRFMVAEWLWIALGRSDLESVAYYNSELRKFSDDGQTLAGAYGPRIAKQIVWAMNKLKEDIDTRQSVIQIFSPTPAPSKDIPCTLSFQFFYRGGKLHLTANMRSSDAWLGLPYDFFTFSMLLNGLCAELCYPVGSVTMNLASSHLYDTDSMRAKGCSNWQSYTLRSPMLPTWPVSDLHDTLDHARMLDNTYSPPWNLYAKAMHQPSKVASLGVMKEIDASAAA